jgi:hypothetical protein
MGARAACTTAASLVLPILIVLGGIAISFAANPWVQSVSPLRELQVSPNGIGGNVVDFSGNANTGVIYGASVPVAGRVTPTNGTGWALGLNGSSDFVGLTTPVAPWGSDMTIETWVKTTASNSARCAAFPILGNWGSASACGVGQIFGTSDGRLKFVVSEDAISGFGDDTVEVYGSFLADDAWHHVAVTIDPAANAVNLYRDGQLDGQGDITVITKSGGGIGPMAQIGHVQAYPADLYFNGALDELAVYNRVLSGAEIAAHYNNGQGTYLLPQPGLTAGWHFDEGPAGTTNNPYSMTAAVRDAQPGDLYWLAQGSYTGAFIVANSGTTNAPIVFRAKPEDRARIVGLFNVTGSNNWIWGLEITDPNNLSTNAASAGIDMLAPGIHAINNIIHDTYDKNGIGAWNTGPGQVVYGNITYRLGIGGVNHPHCIYTQNDFSQYGYKYLVNNMLLDQGDSSSCPVGNCFNFHAYTEGGVITGLDVEKNISRNGRFLIGGFNLPADNEVVIENYFYQSGPQFGYRRPTQVECRSNYVARGTIDTQWFWGAGETVFTQTKPNMFTGNEVYAPPDNHINFRTSAYLSTGRCEGCPAIQPTDVFDHNTYSAPFQAYFFANNNSLGNVNFAAWKSATASAGNAFDVNSVEVPVPTATEYVLLANEYEPGRAHLVIYNWGAASNVLVDLSAVVTNGAAFKILDPRDAYGTPVVSGTYSGPVSIPMGGLEFAAFLVRSIPAAPVNHAPVAQNQSITVKRNVSTTITLTATDADGDALTYHIVALPKHGKLSGFNRSTGRVTYKSNRTFLGADSFTFKANDGKTQSKVATVSIQVVR